MNHQHPGPRPPRPSLSPGCSPTGEGGAGSGGEFRCGRGRREQGGGGGRAGAALWWRRSSGSPAGGRGSGRRHEEAVQPHEAVGQPDRRQVGGGAREPFVRAKRLRGSGRRLSRSPGGAGALGPGPVGLPAPLPSGAFWGTKTCVSSRSAWRGGIGTGPFTAGKLKKKKRQ